MVYLKSKNNFNYLLLLPILGLIFSPPFSFFIAILFLFLLGRYKIEDTNKYIIFFTGIVFFSLLVSMTSTQQFIYEEQDFIGYYNNYLKFFYNGFSLDNFEFGHGIEFVFPFINYILSLIIGTNTPYLILFVYSFLLLSGLLIIIYLISKKYKLTTNEISLLIAFTFLLYKYGTALNHIRQAFASIFILISIFSSKKKYKYLFYLLSIFTHLSSIIIYPLVNFLINEKSTKKLKIFIVATFIISAIFYSSFTIFYNNLMKIDSVFIDKIRFVLLLIKENKDISSYITTTLVGSFYLVLLLFIFMFLKKNKKIKSQWNLYAIIFFTDSLLYLPGFAFRLLDPIYTVLLGFLYFKYLRIEIKFKQTYFLGILMLIFFQYKWIFVNKPYYQKYPMMSYIPFYYLGSYFETKDFTNRTNLPHIKDIKLENRYK